MYLPKRIDGGINMIEIRSAESIARETLKAVLYNEISLVNEAIDKAKKGAKKEVYLNQKISCATTNLLEEAGYTVDDDSDDAEIVITWEGVYNKMSEDKKMIKEIMEELEIKIEASDENL